MREQPTFPYPLAGEVPTVRYCPDGGWCHHGCDLNGVCWRTRYCGPLSGVYVDDEWPPEET